MQKKYKNIFLTTLLILSFVISLHSIIPHDHHNSQSEETLNKQHEDNKNERQPFHCHLFNDLIINKKSISFHNSIKQKIILFKIISHLDIEYYETSINQKLIQNSIHIPDEFFLSENTPTRGSPLI